MEAFSTVCVFVYVCGGGGGGGCPKYSRWYSVYTNFTDDISAQKCRYDGGFEYFATIYFPKNKPKLCQFLQELSYGVLSVSGKNLDSQLSEVSKLISLPTLCCYGLDVT